MTISQLAAYVNVLGIGMTVLISLITASRYQRWFFRFWTIAYCFNFITILLDAVAQLSGRTLVLSLFEVWAGVLGTFFFMLTGDAMVQTRSTRSQLLAGGTLILTTGMIFAGAPASAFMAPIAILVSYAQIRLGIAFLHIGRSPDNPKTTFLAIPLLLIAVLPLTYPFLSPSPHAWIGFVLGTLLHLTIGTGMIIFLLEQISSEMRVQQSDVIKAKNEFLSCVSHELRTPLAIIVGYSELLARDLKEDDGSFNFIEQIQKATTRLTSVINDLLDYSQIESNRLSYNFDEDDLAAVVVDAVDNIRTIALQAGIQMELEVPAHPIVMRLDPNRMTQAMHNLLGNAIKFSPPDGRVEVRIVEDPDGVRVTITDQGTGIPKELQTQIFEKFYQVDSRTTRIAGGLGLGLAICKAIIAEHRGTLGVEDGPEGGSSFWFKLPFRVTTSPLNPAVIIAR